MKKIAGLYQNYRKELQEEFQDYCTGGDKVNELKDFLKNKLNADDFFTAEELLNEVISETEEKGFDIPAASQRNFLQSNKTAPALPGHFFNPSSNP